MESPPVQHRIGFIGNFRHSFCSESHFALSLESLGHQVHRWQEEEVDFRAVPKWVELQDIDYVFWTRTLNLRSDWDYDGQREMLDRLAEKGVTTVAVHLDRYWGLNREGQFKSEPWWQSQYVFSADGGNQQGFREQGINHFWFRPAVFEGECGRRNELSRQDLRADILFVGSTVAYHDEWPWRGELIEHLLRRYGHQFKVMPPPTLRESLLNEVYTASRMVIGDSIFAGKCKNYYSDRYFETIGRGGFLIAPIVDGLDRDLVDGEHLRYFDAGSLDQVDSLIQWASTRREHCDLIRAQGLDHVKKFHTYRRRFAELFWTIEADKAAHDDMNIVYHEIMLDDVYRAAPFVKSDSTVLDIGAHFGMFSTWAARRGAQVIAVEPNDHHRKWFANALCEDVQSSQRIELINGAVGATEGSGTMIGTGVDSVLTTLQPGSVHVYPLESLMPYDGIDFLKIDIEGSEYDVIPATRSETLSKAKRIVIEFHGPDMTVRQVGHNAFGAMITHLARTHAVQILGSPDRGGYIYADSMGAI